MKMASFEHHRPASLAEALALLAEHGPDAKVVAGGQSLVPMMAMRLSTPAHLVDITAIPGLDVIAIVDGMVRVGACVRHSAAERSPLVAERVPLLAKALPWIGHRAIRNRGTVCGSLAHADPAAELPAVALALDAVLVAESVRGTRCIPAADFFEGYLSTALADDELLTAVQLPEAPASSRAVVAELSRRHGDFAIAGVVCALDVDAAGTIQSAALGLFGVGDTPVRASEAEGVLVGAVPTADSIRAASDAVVATLRPPADVHASAAYRRHAARVLTRRALVAALAGAPTTKESAA